MKKKFRKPKPSPPHWYWWAFDNCWDCKNKNNCGGKGCKRLKGIKAIENERRKRKEHRWVTLVEYNFMEKHIN